VTDVLDRSEELVGCQVCVAGWVMSVRKHKNSLFIDLDDGLAAGNRLQVVVDQQGSTVSRVLPSYHSSLLVRGTLVNSSHPAQKVEVLASEVHRVASFEGFASGGAGEYPFESSRHKYPPEHKRKFPMFRAKLNDFAALLRIRSDLSHAIHDFFRKRDYVFAHTPILTSNDCEGAGEVFTVKPAFNHQTNDPPYFGNNVYLTVSGQLHLEALCNGIAKVYNFGPVFRAERGRSRRHLTEFTMIEAELAFTFEMELILETIEALVKHISKQILEGSAHDVALYSKLTGEDNRQQVEKVLNENFRILTYDEAMMQLRKVEGRFKSKPVCGAPLGKEHEIYLVESFCDNVPVFIVKWPLQAKSFYMRVMEDSPGHVSAVDLLLPKVGEVCGGSLREHRPHVLQERLRATGQDSSAVQWYLDMRRYGASPSGGFGLGFERLVQFMLGVNNIRDTLPFPRTSASCLL
jgi:asparaginyl-tRNA synthetase